MSKDNQTELETAILFQRVSDEGKQNTSGKFANMRKLAQSYCNNEILSGNRTGKKYILLEEQFKHMGSAFKHDVSESPTMVDIKERKLDGRLPERCHMLFANADRLSRQGGLDPTQELLHLVNDLGFILHDLYDGVVCDKDDPNVLDNVRRFMDSLERAHNESKRKQRASNEQVYRCLEQIRASEKAGKISPLVDLGTGRGAFLMNKVNPRWITGYDRDKNEWLLNKVEVAKLKYVMSRLSEGATANGLAKELNVQAEKDKTKGYAVYPKNRHDKAPKSYKRWTGSIIKRIYDNKCLIGIFEYSYTDREGNAQVAVFNDYYPKIISLETWQKVKSLVAKRTGRAGKEALKPSIFTGMCRCGYCRDLDGKFTRVRRATPKDKDGNKFYILLCMGELDMKGVCGYTQMYERQLTEVFVRYLKEVDLQKLLRPESGSKAREVRFNIANNKQRLGELFKEQDNIVTAIAKKGLTSLTEKLDSIETEINTVKADITKYENKLRDLTSTSMASFSNDNLKEVEKFLKVDDNVKKLNAEIIQVIDQIEVYPRGLPFNNCLDVVGKKYGTSAQRDKVYGNSFPAFRIHFKNGATRTIIYHLNKRHKAHCVVKNAIVINHDSEKIEVSLDWGKTTMDEMTVLGSSKSELNALDKGIFLVIQSWKDISLSKYKQEYLDRFFEPSTHKEMRAKLDEGKIV